MKDSVKAKVIASLKILGILWLVSSFIALFFGLDTQVAFGNVAVVPIQGEITISEPGGFGSSSASSEDIIMSLERADQNPNIRAILLDINSPGGSPVGTDEISQKIKSINKTTVAVIREVGASGAYWVASSADYVFANRMSLVGSIGVIGSYLDFSGLLHKYNVSYQRYVSGDLKDMGSPFKEPSEEERKVMQNLIDQMKNFFVREVAENRRLSVEEVDKLATGQIFLGSEAKELGLIDALGTKQDALDYISSSMNISAMPVEYKEKKSFSDLFGLMASTESQIGKFINPILNKFQLS